MWFIYFIYFKFNISGVCIMALGAMAKYNKQVTVVMAGLNYFEGN